MKPNENPESAYRPFTIKSFKHDGSLHRIWLENWQVPKSRLHPQHAAESIEVLLNEQTPVREADGKEWISRLPAVAFFLPGEWFNVVALLEEQGVRYYCNLASPYYQYDRILTYIDYDLDLMVMPDGTIHELDRDEFNRHKVEYRYDAEVLMRIEQGLQRLKDRLVRREAPFQDEEVHKYYRDWKETIRSKER
jgi:hypothetical protein